MTVVETKKRLDAALCEIDYACKILNGEVYGDIGYSVLRLLEAKKQLNIISLEFK